MVLKKTTKALNEHQIRLYKMLKVWITILKFSIIIIIIIVNFYSPVVNSAKIEHSAKTLLEVGRDAA